MLRANYLVDAQPLSKVAGLPFSAREIQHVVTEGGQS
jgi:hypothetical protein